MKFSTKQKGTALGMFIGFSSALTVVILGTRFNPFQVNPAADDFQALRIAAISVISVCIFLVFSIGRIARHRFFSPDDIDGAGLTAGTAKVKLLQAELQNTIEQTLLAIIVYFSWAILLPSTWILVVPLAAVSFAIGRILFFAGYSGGAPSRAAGFALTFFPSVLMLILIIYNVTLKLYA